VNKQQIQGFERPINNKEDAEFWAIVRTTTSTEHGLNLIPPGEVVEYIEFREKVRDNIISKLMYTHNMLDIMREKNKGEYIRQLKEDHLDAEEVFLQVKDQLVGFDSVRELPTDFKTKSEIRSFIEALEDKYKVIFVSQKKYGNKNPAAIIKDINSVCESIGRELSTIPSLFNKQKEEMSHELYFNSAINFVFQKCILETDNGDSFDYDPGVFPLITDNDNNPVYTMSRRMDGAYPSCVNPKVLWEVKEYYDNKTYGSRVNDSIYETILSGKECAEVKKLLSEYDIKHLVFFDGFYALGILGRALLLRFIDCFFQRLVDDIIVGSDIIDIWPTITKHLISGKGIQKGFSLFSGMD